VRTVTLDAETDEELARGELVRGYEFEKDRYVTLDEETSSACASNPLSLWQSTSPHKRAS
jgi:non-homologous end joining protein Ku